MLPLVDTLPRKSRLAALLEHFARVEDPRDVRRILHPLPEILFLVVCGTIAECDDYEDIASWGRAHLAFLRRYLPYAQGVPGERWLTIEMNRINPALFSAAFSDWVRESWPDRVDLVAIDAKTSRRSHDRSAGVGPVHLVSAFATTSRLVLGQEAVPDKAGELAAIPVLLERLGAEGGLEGALVSIDAIATNATVAEAIGAQGADLPLAVKANQPTLRAEIEAGFAEAASGALETCIDADKGHGRVEERRTSVLREGRLADLRPPLPRRAAPAARRLHPARRDPRDARGPKPVRDAPLHLLRPPHRQASRRCRAGPLGHREPPPLGARRDLRRRPVAPA